MASSIAGEMTETGSASSDQFKEVDSIKAAFPNRCRVISDVGEFSKVVTVQPENLDVTIKFQLPAGYPSVIPEISIRSESLTEENIADVIQILRSRAREMLGQQMISMLITHAESHLKVLGLKPGKTVNASGHTYVDKQHKKTRKQKEKLKAENETQDEKLPSMKTSDDVVKRIIWDDALKKDDFIVGYIDRFRGLIEKCFSDFSWEDLAAVDYDVLAVPKHRIQYFKYKNVKVWDKTKRIDNVFGSAEGTKTIDVVMKELQELKMLGQTATDSTLDDNGENCKPQSDSSDEDSITDNDDSDDDSDDGGIVVIIGNIAVVKNICVAENSLGCTALDSSCDKCNKSSQIRKPIYNPNRNRPNHFLCIRITNQEIQDKITKLQDVIIAKEPMFSECCIPGTSLHLTLRTLGLDTPEQVLQCIEALKNMKPALESALPTLDLKLHGVSHFNNHVIYAQIQHKDDLHEFCNLLKHLIEEAGLQIRDGFEFVPHVTVMKITRPMSRALGSKYNLPELYSNYINTNFGEQKIDNINLCTIGKERREDGFYETPFELHLKK